MTILPLGDSALLVQLGDAIDAETHERVRSAFDALDSAAVPGFIDIVPAYTGLAVHYDPARFADQGRSQPGTAYDRAEHAVRHALGLDASALGAGAGAHEEVGVGAVGGAGGGRREEGGAGAIEIPVRYGGADGPDLEHVARHAGLSVEEVVRLHSSAEYTVYMIGFSPGFPYLGGLPEAIATPRRASPRQAVPAGSVGIAGAQTGVYPIETPGGWQIIGRTDTPLFRPDLDPPTLLRVGDRVRFIDSGAT